MSSTTEPDRDGRGSTLSTDPARPLPFTGLRATGRLLGPIGVTKVFAHRGQVPRVFVGRAG
ncbi:hypothetical protein ACFYSJ_00190 [Streptomyces sp. NPDC005248]|uniref:hypothetical protein n=1 Tax=Streptomyces sp. NPDC005248 TaxID=3364709 RepID=UPI0036B248C4